MFKKHKKWWFWLIGIDAFAIFINTQTLSLVALAGIAGTMLTHAVGAFVLVLIPIGCYKLLKKKVTSEQFMWTYTVAFSLMLLSFLITKLHEP